MVGSFFCVGEVCIAKKFHAGANEQGTKSRVNNSQILITQRHGDAEGTEKYSSLYIKQPSAKPCRLWTAVA